MSEIETRKGHDLEVRREPEVVSDVPTVVGTLGPHDREPDSLHGALHDGPPPAPPRRRLVVGLAALLTLVLAVTVLLVVLLGGDDEPDVTTRSPQAGSAGPAALGMTVQAPEQVVAGRAARFVVRWTDGEGVLSGGTEEWGDGVGTSSLAQDTCTAEVAAAQQKPSAGRYVVKHTWAEAGSYQVRLAVTTYLCSNGTPTEEQVDTAITVEVAARR